MNRYVPSLAIPSPRRSCFVSLAVLLLFLTLLFPSFTGAAFAGDPPAAPSNMTAVANHGSVVITWDCSPDTIGVEGTYDDGQNGPRPFSASASGGTNGQSFQGYANKAFTLSIRAYNNSDKSGYSSASVKVKLPTPVVSGSIVVNAAGKKLLVLTWPDVDEALSYDVHVSINGGSFGETDVSIPNPRGGSVSFNCGDIGLAPISAYVESVNNSIGHSEKSATISAYSPPTPDGGGGGGGGGGAAAGPPAGPPPDKCNDPNSPQDCPHFDAEEGGLNIWDILGDAGPQVFDPVNLSSGMESYKPTADLTAYNRMGPNALWMRHWFEYQSQMGYGSPGMPIGWVHNYDVRISYYVRSNVHEDGVTNGLGNLRLIYPSGATVDLNVETVNGQPTGRLIPPAGSSFTANATFSNGVISAVSIVWKDRTRWVFNAGSVNDFGGLRLTSLYDPLGHSLALSYNGDGSLASVTSTETGITLLSLTYSNGTLSQVTDAYGRRRVYRVQQDLSTGQTVLVGVSRIGSVIDPVPPDQWIFGYSFVQATTLYVDHATGNVIAVVGYPTTALGTITVTNPAGSTPATSTASIGYEYTSGKVMLLIDGNGNRRVFAYLSDTATRVQIQDSSGAVVHQYTQNFTSDGKTSGTTDATLQQNTNVLAYGDPLNPDQVTSIQDEAGRQSISTYDAYGNPLTETGPRGDGATSVYDYAVFPLGRLLSVQEHSANNTVHPATTFTYYEPSGLVHTVTGPSPTGTGTVTSTFEYDALGNLTHVEGPGNNATTTVAVTLNYTTDGTYTQVAALGQPLVVTDSLGHSSHFRYDAQGRLIAAWDALGNRSDVSYTLSGQPEYAYLPATGQTGAMRGYSLNMYQYEGGPLSATRLYDESGVKIREVAYAYGKEGELLGVSGDTPNPFTREYDAFYRLKALRDGANHATLYSYDTAGRLAQMQYPGGATVQYPSYDASGLLLQKIDGNGVVTNYTYNDPEGLLTNVQYPATPALNATYTYDTWGRPQSVMDQAGTRSATYGDLDQVLTATTQYTGVPSQTLSYSYYPDGSRAGMTTPAGAFAYTYDAAGRPTSLTNPLGETTHWSWYDNGWLYQQTNANQTFTGYDYTPLGQPTGVYNGHNFGDNPYGAGSGDAIDKFTLMGYDGAGNRTWVASEYFAVPSLNGSLAYQYDSKSRLTQEVSLRPGYGAGSYTHTFGHDAAGNPTVLRGQSLGAFNADNQSAGVSFPGFAFDGNGNPTTYSGSSVAFDANNKATAFGTTLAAGYTSGGVRAWKQTGSTSASRRYFLYDGGVPVEELDGSGNPLALNTFGADGLISRTPAGSSGPNAADSIFYYFDERGNTSRRLDALGLEKNRHLYEAYGLTVALASFDTPTDTSDPYDGFGAKYGYQTDHETGLILCTFRYYDPSTGRWLNRDPMGSAGGINLYEYCLGNPVMGIDPLGLEPPTMDEVFENGVSTGFGLIGLYLGGIGGGGLGLGGGPAAEVTVPLGATAGAAGGAIAGAALGKLIGHGINAASSWVAEHWMQSQAQGGGSGGSGGSSSTCPSHWLDPATLGRHYRDHKDDVGASSPEEYANKANRFWNRRNERQIKVSIDEGEDRIYTLDPNSRLFGVYDLQGKTRTFYKLSPQQIRNGYFDKQGTNPVRVIK